MAVICGTGGARSDVLAAEEPVAIVTDHTGRLTQDQIQALAVGEWAYTGFSEDLDWINTRSFFAMEVLSVEQSGERYTLETLQGNVLFSWLLHGTDYEDGVAVAAFGIPVRLADGLSLAGWPIYVFGQRERGRNAAVGRCGV